ncbi:MAG TPA: YceI family protein [Steroidobacteraceae bacterium]|nr:YceI family protein [Steroidobacteraceae bacterium]
MSGPCKLLLAGALLLATLTGCPLRPPAAIPPAAAPPPAAQAAAQAAGVTPLQGEPYDIDGPASLLTILVYRGGALASVGHNHVIASHQLGGTFYVPADIRRSRGEIQVPVATLSVDEASLRAQQSGADFPPDVSESAKEGTRHNMLGDALLDAGEFPEIVLHANLDADAGPAGDGGGGAPGAAPASATGTLLAQVQATVRGRQRSFAVPVRYELAGGTLTLSGATSLRQSELGLTPFSAMLGALQVQDEMQVAFRIVAHLASVTHSPAGQK